MNTGISPTSPLRVIVSLDVEEEGLFSGSYRRRGCTVENVQRLTRLAPLSDELGFPLTLFCAHAVFSDSAACRVLETMRDRHGAEIGAHLHHWSTPPFENEDVFTSSTPVRTDKLERDLLQRRMESLLQAGASFQGAPLTSFRMGRWDLKSCLFPMLAELGIHADSSICPLRAFNKGGADHFAAPAVPYWPLGRNVPLLELPVTQIPLLPVLSRLWYGLGQGKAWLDNFHFLAALSANPFWHSDAIMHLAVRLLVSRNIPVLGLFWHSSEIMPGASPHVPDEAAAEKVLARIRAFLTWLKENFPVRGMTATELFTEAQQTAAHQAGTLPVFPERRDLPSCGDW